MNIDLRDLPDDELDRLRTRFEVVLAQTAQRIVELRDSIAERQKHLDEMLAQAEEVADELLRRSR